MNVIRLLSLALFIISLMIGGFYLYNRVDPEPIELKEVSNELQNDIERIGSREEKAYQWIYTEDIDYAYLEEIEREWIEKYQKPKHMVEYLFAAITLDDIELFVEAFEPGVISQDLFLVDTIDKEKVAKDIITRITRNDKLSEVNYLSERLTNHHYEAKVEVQLLYEDDKKVRLPLEMRLFGTSHHDDDEVFYITTSAWDIIDTIEKQTSE
ncbi:hypothetical protein [Desertibacillus haloalkaliphilus]|uniref:hypothetical protein n=1 Tax=Desertibacillus haloalkaliphilus TaxID=1328930 RepID=UPI001C276FC8|nr:hypothetical protein [Desertibacillus haloalkaliphilus]MBU8908096.1 hypothetical protein [Desertibacillus haloalkaliphilus]